MLRKQHKSYQNMYTKWDAWDNKIDLFEFEKSNSFESSFEYINNDGKYFNILGIRHNLFKSNNTILYIAKNLEFKI